MREYLLRIEDAKKSLRMTEFPSQVVVESTAFCDFQCPGCPSPILERLRGGIKPELFRKIIDEIAEKSPQTQLWFAFMGEAFLWKPLFDIIRYATEKGVENTRLNTNGNIMTERFHELMRNSGLRRIIISIDGHSRETFNTIRLGGEYEKVKANTISLLSKAQKEKWVKPEIWVQMIVMETNAHEENEFRNFWLSQGAVVKIRPRLSWGSRVNAPGIMQADITRDFPCPWLMRQVIISWDGQILQCGSDHEARYPVGNVNTMSIEDAWNGKLKTLRTAHLANNFNFPPCMDCPDWKVGISEIYHNTKSENLPEL